MWAGAKIVWCEPNNHFRFYCTIAQGDNNNNNSANDFFYFFPSRFVGFVECFNSSVVECFCHPCTFHFVFMSHERKKQTKSCTIQPLWIFINELWKRVTNNEPTLTKFYPAKCEGAIAAAHRCTELKIK